MDELKQGEYIDKDGNLEITLKEYNERTDVSMIKQFALWITLAALVLFTNALSVKVTVRSPISFALA